MGVVVMAMFSLPFLVVFFWSKKNWWALIPAGVFLSIAVVVLLATNHIGTNGEQGSLPPAVMMAGIGTTFGILWLMRHSQPTFWAKYPALGLYAAALLALFTGERFQNVLADCAYHRWSGLDIHLRIQETGEDPGETSNPDR